MTNETNSWSPVIILLAILLLAAAVWLIGTSFYQDAQPAALEEIEFVNESAPSAPISDADLDDLSNFVIQLNRGDVPEAGRDLDTYYERRAYSGAPPIIPHPIDDETFGGNACLSCHVTGDYVPPMEAFAPIVPHPDLTSCTSCHVPSSTSTLFAESDWQVVDPPALGQAALFGSPPPIPHGLEMRQTCLSCHAGPAAPEELRFDHPERTSCEQCHVAIEEGGEWER